MNTEGLLSQRVKVVLRRFHPQTPREIIRGIVTGTWMKPGAHGAGDGFQEHPGSGISSAAGAAGRDGQQGVLDSPTVRSGTRKSSPLAHRPRSWITKSSGTR